jgi:hypothetical protein
MKQIKKKKNLVKKDFAKERSFKALVATFALAGVEVRREKLKRGLGWRVQSGACRLEVGTEEKRIIFVDQRLSQDDQLNFLREKARGMGLNLADEAPDVES